MANALRSRFGTARGLVRLALSYGEVAAGRAAISVPEPAKIRRLVFVCQGNICRSAFADVVAKARGMRAVSVGLSTDAGRPAHPPAVDAAKALEFDLSDHHARRIQDYVPQDGDMLLAMETRQLWLLAADPRLAGVPRTLLGLWTAPKVPHLHDPFGLDQDYMLTCLTRIEAAVTALKPDFPGAILS